MMHSVCMTVSLRRATVVYVHRVQLTSALTAALYVTSLQLTILPVTDSGLAGVRRCSDSAASHQL